MKSHLYSSIFIRYLNPDKYGIKGLKFSWQMLLAFIILFASPLIAQIPRTISYQGILTDNSGNPKPDGDYSITFSFYEEEINGDPVWTESKNLHVSKGLFSTLLGDQTKFGSNVEFDKPYFLGIKIGDEEELPPRIALTPAGYSFSSIYADTAKNIIEGKVVKSLNGLMNNVKILGDGGTTVNTTGDTIMISSSSSSEGGIQELTNTNGTIDITNPNGSKTTINLKLPVSSAVNSDTAKNIINGKVVKSLNGLRDDVTLEGSGGTTINKNGSKITISSSSGSSGIQEINNTDSTISITNPNGSTTTLNLKVPLSLTGSSVTTIFNSTNTVLGDGIRGKSSAGGRGVYGLSSSGVGVSGESDNYIGIYGKSNANGQLAIGVYGVGNEFGVFGTTASGDGVYGKTNDPLGKGVMGYSGVSADGVYGHSVNGIGVHGYSAHSADGVYGKSEEGAGVRGETNAYYGVYGHSNDGAGVGGESNGYGLLGRGHGQFGVGVYASSDNWYAGDFQGNVHVNGTLSKSAGSFKINHPLDPANKYLSHSFVESPDMMNVYNGNLTSDINGTAIVTLPDWFEALNKDFRYQLTVIGQFSQAIIESEIQNNQFTIKTDKPNVKVSWQVTGIRKDAYAEKNRIKVEEIKSGRERGKYLHPELFGQPKKMGIHYAEEVEVKNILPSERMINLPEIKNPDELENGARR